MTFKNFETYDQKSQEIIYRDDLDALKTMRINNIPNYNSIVIDVEPIDNYKVMVIWDNGEKTVENI